ncbi:MAG: SOS response-associated peptidase [Acidobacteriota bacterium]|nr:SOS response-associated peptidase [Acidobacteriota bacterium]
MCGRFTQTAKPKEIEKEFAVKIAPDVLFKPRYNIAPTQIIPAVLESDGERIIEGLRWGLIPSWAKDESIGNKLINARAETLAEKPSFKNAFRSHRCIIPASGFYEWQKTAKGAKQPFYFHLKDKGVFGFAGLYEQWLDRETGEQIETCTIITTEANKVLEPIHDRTPVILKPESYEQWLDAKEKDINKLQKLLAPYAAAEMDSYKVSKSVNIPDNDSPELIKNSA